MVILGVNFGGHVGFWVKNKDQGVNLQGLGKPGKKKTFKNVRKRSKTFKNIQKFTNFEYKRSKIFKNIRIFLTLIAQQSSATDFPD